MLTPFQAVPTTGRVHSYTIFLQVKGYMGQSPDQLLPSRKAKALLRLVQTVIKSDLSIAESLDNFAPG
ncbi:hypothetical protein PCASD_02924 [Puccinia coronata f. sp. avenae]|uniref:Uncharacterized protein n=1 Tax=Puccinia coronata f. sp. avenae TaxID=200324 RepID=A0A2N5VEH6_9BASI|nr:hypothetical protein PCASD_02924 [Puccinia coronata f. sp. avenae]